MTDYQESLREETEYLENTLALIQKEKEAEEKRLAARKRFWMNAGKEMWEESVHFSTDFEKMVDVSQHLSEITYQSSTYVMSVKQHERYQRMLNSPYFGRFDFTEQDMDLEKIYIGLHNLTDTGTQDIFVYDWRSPIASIFYRYEPGEAKYRAPFGEICGKVSLKRQYNIQHSQIKYFFDCSVRIGDEILQEVLSRNASPKMRSIVETIQKEQDLIIRDMDHDLLMVQGVAGSGKTSIAMHRVAFLLYEGLESKLDADHMIILSPNAAFSHYISEVLPELGEENVAKMTMEELFQVCIGEQYRTESRSQQLEKLVCSTKSTERAYMLEKMHFKGSRTFVTILDRFLRYFERKLLAFDDIYYDGKILWGRYQLKNEFLNNKIGMPMVKRLKRMESNILKVMHPLQKQRLPRIEKIVQKGSEHEFEIKSFSRLLSIKESKTFTKKLHKFTEVDCLSLYRRLLRDPMLFYRLSEGLVLPDNIGSILQDTVHSLEDELLSYEDAMALLYLQLKIEGSDTFTQICQVIVDEAQDYTPMHYEILKLMFTDARFTVVGDISQAIEKHADAALYEDIARIFNKPKTIRYTLQKSYRASSEINAFAQQLLDVTQDVVSFERHEQEPQIIGRETWEQLDQVVLEDVEAFRQEGFTSVALICRTEAQCRELYQRIGSKTKTKLFDAQDSRLEAGVTILPAYMAKGLEFDVAMVYGVDESNYKDDLDRKLLYIACTRALHRLHLYYTGRKAMFL